MFLDRLCRSVLKWPLRKHIQFCRERAALWRQQERAAIESGVSPLNERIVRIRKIRQGFEELTAAMSNPPIEEKDIQIATKAWELKLKKCIKREAAIFKDAGIR